MKPKRRVQVFPGLKKCLLLALLLTLSMSVYSQNLIISGGNTVSATMCTNGNMYTWGNNGGQLLGHDGPNPTTAPRRVIFPTNDPYFTHLGTGVTVKNVDAGSGAHFIVSDCYGGVWSWGNNSHGQTGTGTTTAAPINRPTRVLKGQHPGGGHIHPSLADYLVDITFIAGGNNSSYVVTEGGEVLSWGDNSFGQLGNGTTVNSTTPVYVLTEADQRLNNIIEVAAGDQTTYARTLDGRVYSWGAAANGKLGRPNNNNTYAREVVLANGQPLRNIVSLNSGDVMCLALDADGYVWAWGDGGWNGPTGQGNTIAHAEPKRVVAGQWGTTPGTAGFGETYLRAKAISGGQGFGTAITIDGIPVAWGNNGACGTGTANSGGNLGDGTTTHRTSPVFIRTGAAADAYHKNAIYISAADTWGFYITDQNQIYTWGNNAVGQLGLGNTTCRSYATLFTLPNCTSPAPNPKAEISPRSFSVCSAKWTGTTLRNNFTVGTALASDYSVKWFRNGGLLSNGTAANNLTLNATQTGQYIVEVAYTGPDAPCTPYEIARDTIIISEWVRQFTVPDDLTFCGDSITAKVATGSGVYQWFTAPTGGVSLGRSIRTNNVKFPKTAVTEVNNSEYTVYVEETSFANGNVGSVRPATCEAENLQDPRTSNSMLRVFDGKVTIDTISIYHQGEYQGSTKNYNWQVCIYGTKLDNQSRPVADRTKIISCGPVVSLPSHNDQNSRIELKVPVNITLEGTESGTDYWIGFSNATTGIRATYFKCNPNYPVRDDVPNGEFLNMLSADKDGNFNTTAHWGIFSNIQFTANQRFCTRVPVVIKEDCPCAAPKEITLDPATKTTLCEGSDLLIKAAADTTDLTPLKGYHFTWFHDGTPLAAASRTYTDLQVTAITPDKAGVYTLRIEDGNTGTSSCYLEKSVEIAVDKEVVPGTITDDQIICTGTAPLELTSDTAPSGGNTTDGFTYQWQVSTTGNDDAAFSDISGATAETFTPNALTADTWFRRTVSSGVCSPAYTNAVFIDVVDEVTPGVIGTDTEICINSIPPAIEETTAAGGGLGAATYIYKWYSSTNEGDTWSEIANANSENYTPAAPVSVETWYRRNVKSGPCDSVYSNIVKITIKPEVLGGSIAADQRTCYNVAPDPITSAHPASGGDGANYAYSWESSSDEGATWNPEAGTGTGFTVGALTETTWFRRMATSGNDAACNTAYSDTVKITIYNEPLAGTITDDQIICTGTSPLSLISDIAPSGGDADSGFNYQWQISTTGTNDAAFSNIAGATAETYAPNALTADSWFRRMVSSGVCTPVFTNAVFIDVVDEVTPGVIGTDTEICINTIPPTIEETSAAGGGLGAATYAYQWYSSIDGGNTWNEITNETSEDYTPSAPISVETWYRRNVKSGPCDSVYSNIVKITIKPEVLGGSIAADQRTCYNVAPEPITNAQLASGGDGINYAFSWESSTDEGTTWNPEAGTGAGYTVGALTQTTWFRRMVTSGNDAACNTAYSDTVKITVYNEPLAGTIEDNQIICHNQTPAQITNATSPSGGDTQNAVPYTYRWLQSTASQTGPFTAAGGTGANFQAGNLTETTWFVREVTSGNCMPVNSNAVEVTVTAPLTAGTIGSDAQICGGTSPGELVQIDAPTGGDGTYTYVWQKSENGGPWVDIAGATNAQYTPDNIYEETRFRRLVSSGPCTAVESNVVTISVLPGLLPGVIEQDQTICYGATPAQITSVSAASGGTAGVYTYSWQQASIADAENDNWTTISGITALTYTPGALTETTLYRRVVVSGTGTCNTSVTDPIQITVYDDLTPGSIGSTQSICEGVIPNALTEITPATGGTGTYTYAWEKSEDNGTSWTAIAGANATGYAPPALSQTTVYRRNVTSGNCGTETSAEVVINVTQNVPVSVTISNPGNICINEPASFTATPVNEGNTPVYRWEVDGNPVTGETGPSFSSTTLQNGQVVRVILTSSITCTTGNPATSNAVTMNVTTSVTPAVTINTPSAICENDNVTFTATPSGGGNNPTYRWFVNNVAQGPAGPTATWSSTQLNNSDRVHVVMTSNSLCLSDPNNPNATSNIHTMAVTPNATVSVTINEPAAICAGTSVTFTATPVNGGNSPTYQWLVNGQPRGLNNASFTSNTLQNGDVVSVRLTSSLNCTVANPVTSNSHTMTVNPVLPVSVSLQGPSGRICEGALAEFTATPTNGGNNPQYRWYVGTQLQTETSNEFSSTSLTDGQIIRVELTSSETCNSGPASSQVNVNVFTIPIVTVTPTPVVMCEGSSQLLTPSSTNIPAGSTYEWLKDNISTGTTSRFFVANEEGAYTVEVTFPFGCSTTSQAANVTVLPVPDPVIKEGDTTICEGEYAAFTVDHTGGSLQWYLNGVILPGEVSETIHTNQPGHYTVVESNGTCDTRSTVVNLLVVPVPVPNAGPDRTVIEGAPVQLLATGGESFEWFPRDGLSDANIQNPIFIAEDNITYTVTVSNGRCSAEDEVNIIVQKPIVVRNSFTPNGDNINDTWFIENLERFPEARIEIYNRWGSLVWLSDGPAEWNGTNFRNNEILPVATYYYVIILNSEIFDKPYTGHVTIVR